MLFECWARRSFRFDIIFNHVTIWHFVIVSSPNSSQMTVNRFGFQTNNCFKHLELVFFSLLLFSCRLLSLVAQTKIHFLLFFTRFYSNLFPVGIFFSLYFEVFFPKFSECFSINCNFTHHQLLFNLIEVWKSINIYVSYEWLITWHLSVCHEVCFRSMWLSKLNAVDRYFQHTTSFEIDFDSRTIKNSCDIEKYKEMVKKCVQNWTWLLVIDVDIVKEASKQPSVKAFTRCPIVGCTNKFLYWNIRFD